MDIQHLPADAGAETVNAALAQDGAVIVDDLVGEDLLDRVEAELAPSLAATPPGPDDFSGRNTRRTGALVARSPASRELITHPLVLATAGGFLGHATNFQLHLTQAIAIGPESPAQPIHRDQWAFDFFPFPAGYEVQCNTIWAMTDFTEANGATRVVLGSNRAEDGLHYVQSDTVPAEMKRGSLLVYSGSVYHGGGANTTSETRIGLNITYNLAWLRQEENQYLSVPREVAETLPEDLLRLMGYARGAYALGYIDDLRDPIEAIRPSGSAVGFAPLERLSRSLSLRLAVRAVVLDDADRLLLVRFRFPDGSVWALPGGGKEPGEDDATALRRELAEEIGLLDFLAVGPIWQRTHIFPMPGAFDGQAEQIYLIRTEAFEPAPQMSWDELNGEGMVEIRWWAADDLATSGAHFAPSRLAALTAELVATGSPTRTVDVGE